MFIKDGAKVECELGKGDDGEWMLCIKATDSKSMEQFKELQRETGWMRDNGSILILAEFCASYSAKEFRVDYNIYSGPDIVCGPKELRQLQAWKPNKE